MTNEELFVRDEEEIIELFKKLKEIYGSTFSNSPDHMELTHDGRMWTEALQWVLGKDCVLDIGALIEDYDPEKQEHSFKTKAQKEREEWEKENR